MGYQSPDLLMRHLNDSGISIDASQKQLLLNMGYFHGYKGYRFFRHRNVLIPYHSFAELYATFQYDSALKALLYDRVVFIETATKNRVLESTLRMADSEDISDIFQQVIAGFRNAPANLPREKKKRIQQDKLEVQSVVQKIIAENYRHDNPIITHYYLSGTHKNIPLWAIFEVMTMGNFGRFLSCLTYDVRDTIAKDLHMNLALDSGRIMLHRYIWLLKDLRNAIAHNAVVFDTRFRQFDPSKAMKKYLVNETGLPFVDFHNIGDYIALTCYFMKILGAADTELRSFLDAFGSLSTAYREKVSPPVSSVVLQRQLEHRIEILKKTLLPLA